MDLVEELYAAKSIYIHYSEIIDILREANYYEYKVVYESFPVEKDDRYYRYWDWCEENCKRDYYRHKEIFMFTDKNFVTLMKLSVV